MVVRVGEDGCKNCSLYTEQFQNKVVKNWVNTEATLAFLGLGPGSTEQKELIPFIGDAGQILRNFIVKAGKHPDDFSYVNCVLCRPPGNKIDSIMTAACRHNFTESLKSMPKLKYIALLGVEAYNFITRNKPAMKDIYKQVLYFPMDYPNITFIALYHPASCLYGDKGNRKKLIEEGIKYVVNL